MDRRIEESSTKVFSTSKIYHPPIRNPIKVMDSTGKTIGVATVSFDALGFKMEFFLDPHTPEAFDIEVKTGRANIKPSLTIDDDGLDGVIVIE